MLLALAACVFRLSPSDETEPSTDSGSPPPLAVPYLSGARGSEGVLLWSDDPQGGWMLQYSDGAGWGDLRDDDAPWFDPDAPADRGYRLRDPRSEQVSAEASLTPITAEVSLAADLRLAGEEVALTPTVGVEAESFPTGLQRSRDGLWLNPDCLAGGLLLESCWQVEFATITAGQVLRWDASLDTTRSLDLRLAVTRTDGRGDRVVVAADSLTVTELGRSVAWGDPHAHSNLSQDGCEVYEDACRTRKATAAADFFAQARARGLDFAALTDHAEYSYLYPEGSEAETVIWQTQQDLALAADNGTFLPLVGYEWTNFNGHRTVLFEQISVCASLRVSGKASPDDVIRLGVGDELVAANTVIALTPAALWTALDEASETCATSRILAIPHHTAMRLPEPVIWSDDLNTPDPRYERLVEITSEHGTSECLDLKAEHCDYRLKSIGGYESRGSIQAMLQQGYTLGFVGGTDSHDSQPGSTENGPSCVSLDGELTDTSEYTIPCHDHPGGLTGVLVAGTLTRETLFDGLEARNTLASTAVPIDARAVLRAADAVYLPGDDVPAGDYTLAVLVPTDGMVLLSIEAIDQDGARRALLDRAAGEAEISVASGESVYLRVRVSVDGIEERIWLSPFFAR